METEKKQNTKKEKTVETSKEVKEETKDAKEKLKEVKKEIKEKVETSKTKKETSKTDLKEYKEFTIPLREKCRPVPRYKKANKAIKTIKEFLVRHMKIYNKDLNKIKLDKFLNEAVWARGIKKPPHKIKVKAYKEGEFVRVELSDFSKKLKFKKLREEKQELKALEKKGKKKSLIEKAKESKKEKKSEEEKEKVKSGLEAAKQMEKKLAKNIKHKSGGKIKEKTQPQRKALAK